MIKKLVALLFLSSAAHAFVPVRYVQISTNTLNRQSGTAVVDGINVSTLTVISSITIQGTFPILSTSTLQAGSTFYVSSGTIANLNISSMTAASPTGKIASLSSIRFSPTTNGILGTTTNDSATAGNVGEYIQAIAGDSAAPTSTQYGDLTSISLTAGDWDVSGGVYWDSNTATWTVAQGGISVTSGNSATGLNAGENLATASWASSSTTPLIQTSFVASYRISIAATTTVYLKYRSTYTGGPPHAQGRLSARRVR